MKNHFKLWRFIDTTTTARKRHYPGYLGISSRGDTKKHHLFIALRLTPTRKCSLPNISAWKAPDYELA